MKKILTRDVLMLVITWCAVFLADTVLFTLALGVAGTLLCVTTTHPSVHPHIRPRVGDINLHWYGVLYISILISGFLSPLHFIFMMVVVGRYFGVAVSTFLSVAACTAFGYFVVNIHNGATPLLLACFAFAGLVAGLAWPRIIALTKE